MNLFAKIIFGFAVGAVTYGVMSLYYSKKKTKIVKPVPEESRLEILKKYSEYDTGVKSKEYPAAFVLNNKIPDILLKYDYLEYSGRSLANEDDIVFAMLDFVCDHFMHDGNICLPQDRSMVGIIEGSEKIGLKTNCRGLSLILAELLRINGIKARHVTCKPYEEPFSDCHVVVDCIMPSGTRIMLDPTYRLYFVDDNGAYVSIAQLREGIIRGVDFHPNSNASRNGEEFHYDDYKEYMAKNLLRLNTNYILDDSIPDREATEIELIPKGYTTEKFAKRIKFVTDPISFWNI